jgi:hypothetical protein
MAGFQAVTAFHVGKSSLRAASMQTPAGGSRSAVCVCDCVQPTGVWS